ncbi:MAG: hypothetical protein RL885_11590 [Planctomycetota bacterium]
MITVTSYDAVGERAHAESSATETVAFDLIEELDRHLEHRAPWAHRIDDLSDVFDALHADVVRDEDGSWMAWSGRVRVRAPRGTWTDGQCVRLCGFDAYAYEAEDLADHYLLSVYSR